MQGWDAAAASVVSRVCEPHGYLTGLRTGSQYLIITGRPVWQSHINASSIPIELARFYAANTPKGPTNSGEVTLYAAELAAQADLLRCIAGSPYRPVACDPSWRTSTVVGLAAAIYADRAFDRLPVLADALEDAGCDCPDFLGHCRNHPEHARGCWVVDKILGKS